MESIFFERKEESFEIETDDFRREREWILHAGIFFFFKKKKGFHITSQL